MKKPSLHLKQIQNLKEVESDPLVLDYYPLTEIAKEFFEAFGHLEFTEICGPISTGPINTTREERIKKLEQAIEVIGSYEQEERFIFDQLPFERAIHAIKKRRNLDCYDMGIHNHFYEKLFEEVPNLNELMFLPDYEYSVGANLEHQTGLMLPDKMKIIYLEPNWLEMIKSDKIWYQERWKAAYI